MVASVGTSLTAVMLVPRPMPVVANLMLLLTSAVERVSVAAAVLQVVTAELSMARTVNALGVPLKLAAGRKRSLVVAALFWISNAVASLTVPMACQLVPLLVVYCQTPSPAVAALAVMAMPAKLLPSPSENLALNRLVMLSPVLRAEVMSSATDTSVASLLNTGASLTAATVTLTCLAAVKTLPS